jgi:hypothetical protein
VTPADPLRALVKSLLENNGGPTGGDSYFGDEFPDTHVLVRIEDFKALEALLAAPVASGWQPIATVPPGTMVLVCSMRAVEARNWCFVDWFVDGKGIQHPKRYPTHWMPLPAPPVASPDETK